MLVHTTAVKTAIQTVTGLASKTFVSVAPRTAGVLPAAPYVVIHPSDGDDSQERLTGPRREYHPAFTLHVVGASYDNAQTVTELIKAKFVVSGLGVYLTVSGETTERCVWSVPIPTQVDNSLTPPLIYNVVELAFDSYPS
jgi:hypothetical protein